MRTRRNWLKTTIAMLTLVATVLETGFSTVSTFAAETTTEDGIVVNTDAVEETGGDSYSDEDLQIEVTPDDEYLDDEYTDDGAGEDYSSDEYSFEGNSSSSDDFTDDSDNRGSAMLEVSSNGISGTGYDEVSIFVDTEGLANKDTFRIRFEGPDAASYNPVINNDLDKTNDGRYDFENLEGGDFSIRATASDNVILSYKYNDNGTPVIVVESKPVEKVLDTRILSAEDGSKVEAVIGEGYESFTLKFDTEDLSDRSRFKLFVESDANAKVDGKNASSGITGLSAKTESVTITDLENEPFTAYLVSDTDVKIETIAESFEIEDGTVTIDINDVAVKRVYEYEDSDIYVRATLEEVEAVPDDADFIVTKLEPETQEYNYDTYMEALNENSEEIMGSDSETVEFNADNTLLYDIGFFVDEDGNKVEFEPAEGSVRFEIKFKRQQLAESENDDAISVVHLPLKEAVKGSVDTTADAVNITTKDINVEVVENNSASVTNGTVEFNLDNLSVVAIVDRDHADIMGTLNAEPKTGFTTKELLNKSWLYGITANNLNFVSGGDAETNFAAKNVDNQSCSQTGMTDKASGSLHSYYLLKNFTGNTLKLKDTMDVDVTFPHGREYEYIKQKMISTDTEHNKSPHVEYKHDGAANIDTLFSNMMTNASTASSTLAGRNSVSSSNTGLLSNTTKICINLLNDPDGTYYFDADEIPNIRKALNENGALEIKKKDTQKIVFNFKGTNKVHLDKYILNGTDSVGMANNSSRTGTHIEDIIFNIPNATEVELQDQAGIFIAPNATVKVGGVGGGWLIANTVNLNCEWHFTNGDIPEPGDVEVNIPVRKTFEGGAGKWEGGFKFYLQEVAENTWTNVGDPVGPIILNGGDNEVADSEFTLTFNPKELNFWGADPADKREGFNWVTTKWYRVYEIEDRDDVEYNIYDHNPPGEAPNCDYWYAHVFIYTNNKDNPTKFKTSVRTARKEPNGYDYKKYGLPCEDGRRIEFVNTPKEVYTDVDLSGIKKIILSDNTESTEPIPDGMFKFSLYNYLGSNTFDTTPKVIDGVSQEKWNVGNTVTFDTFKVKFLDGTGYNNDDKKLATESYLYFLIKETDCKDTTAYTMDDSQYVAKVIVKKTGNGLTSSVEYYKFTEKDGNGNVIVDVTKAMNGTTDNFTFKASEFAFRNKYNPNPTSTVIYGAKVMENRDLHDDEFTFKIENSTGDNADPSFDKFTNTVVTNKSGKFSFTTREYTASDLGKSYTYRVSELVPQRDELDNPIPNVYYDETIYDVTVTITRNSKGDLIATPDRGATEEAALTFTNTYSTEVTFKAQKKYADGLLKKDKDKKEKFKFYLKEYSDSDWTTLVPDSTREVEVTGENIGTFGEKIDYDKEGKHYYTINEDVTGCDPILDNDGKETGYYTKNGIKYDGRIYYILVDVKKNSEGNLAPHIKAGYKKDKLVDKGEVLVVTPEFENDYGTKSTKTIIDGIKKLSGGSLVDYEFEFELKPYGSLTTGKVEDGKVVMPATQYLKVKNDKQGNIVFGKEGEADGYIVFNEPETYWFVVSETRPAVTAPDETKIKYTDDVYIVKVKVEDDGAGNLIVKEKKAYRCDKDANGNPVKSTATYIQTGVEFTNEIVDDTKVSLSAKKQVVDSEGNPIELNKKKVFTFELKDVTDPNNTSVYDTATCTSDGEAKFKDLKYTLKDMGQLTQKKFKYQISEKLPDEGKGYTLDKDNYYVKDGDPYKYSSKVEEIEVTVNVEKDPVTKKTILRATASPDKASFTFTNVYTAKGKYPINGIKEITGREYKDTDPFQAELYIIENGVERKIATTDIDPDDSIFTKIKSIFGLEKINGYFEFNTNDNNKVNELCFDETDIGKDFHFRVKEIGTVEGVINGVTVKDIKLKITDDDESDGKLNIDDTDSQLTNGYVHFINHHTEFGFKACKKIVDANGKEVTFDDKFDGKFTFVLEEKKSDTEWKNLQSKKNNALGTVEFDKIVYKQEDLARSPIVYRIREDATQRVANITGYDDSIYTVTVTLSEKEVNGKNKIVATPVYQITKKNDNGEYVTSTIDGADEGYVMEFTNVYDAEGPVEITVVKTLENGGDLGAGDFTFDLYTADGTNTLVGSTSTIAATANNNGIATCEVAFPAINYTLKDLTEKISVDGEKETYIKRYYMIERHPDDAVYNNTDGNWYYKGLVYDGSKHFVDVYLYHNNLGKIETKWRAYKEGETVTELTGWDAIVQFFTGKSHGNNEFINKYNPKGWFTLDAIKVMTGGKTLADFEDGFFEFELFDGNDGKDINFYEEVQNVNPAPVRIATGHSDDWWLEFTSAGTYTYKVKEVIPAGATKENDYTVNGVKYDNTVHTVEIEAIDNGVGSFDYKVKIDGVELEDKYIGYVLHEDQENGRDINRGAIIDADGVIKTPTFTNEYLVKPVEIRFDGTKVLEGGPALKDGQFSFVLQRYKGLDAAGEPAYEDVETVKNDADGNFSFTALKYTGTSMLKDENSTEYDTQKTFKYRVRELNDKGEPVTGTFKVNGITYTGKIISIQVTVTDNNGVLEAEVNSDDTSNTVTASGNEYSDTPKAVNVGEFVNNYLAEGETVLNVTKQIDGPVLDEDKVFEFVLKEVENDTGKETIPGGSEKISITVKKGETTGVGSFSKIKYDVKNLNKLNDGTFKGTYKYTVYELIPGDPDFKPAANDGNFKFSKELYTNVVTVTDDGAGELHVDDQNIVKTKDVDGNAISKDIEGLTVDFTNKYLAEGEFEFDGFKEMTDLPIVDGEYKFILKDSDGKQVDEVTTVSVDQISKKSPLVKVKDENGKYVYKANAGFSFPSEDAKKEAAPYFRFDQSILDKKDSNGVVHKYYTVEEAFDEKKGGVTYSDAVFVIEVRITDDKHGTLNCDVYAVECVRPDDGNVSALIDQVKDTITEKNKITGLEKSTVVFKNNYDSECPIDPPILLKQNFGREFKAGDYTFEITGPVLSTTAPQNIKNGKFWSRVENGKDDKGNLLPPDKVGEIYVGNVLYKYEDLTYDEATEKASGQFIYNAKEVKGGLDGEDYSDQEYQLVVNIEDNGDGTMNCWNARNELVVDHGKLTGTAELYWESIGVTYALSDEEMSNTFLNRFNQEGYINLVGLKKLDGRDLTEDDKFEFTLTDDPKRYPAGATPKSVTRSNENDAYYGPSSVIAFNGKDDKGKDDIDFLNYRFGDFVTNPNRKDGEPVEFERVDDRGTYTYTLVENVISSNPFVERDTSTWKITVEVKSEVDKDGNYVLEKDSSGRLHGKLVATVIKAVREPSEAGKLPEIHNGPLQKYGHFEFVNKFRASNKIDLTGIKYIKDQDDVQKAVPNDKLKEFSFKLYQYDNEKRLGTGTLIQEVYADNYGKFKFNIPEYTQELFKVGSVYNTKDPKTLYYRVEEVPPSDGTWTNGNTVFESKGYIYDTGHYDIDVTVTMNPNSDKLTVVKTDHDTGKVLTDSDEYKYIAFTNIEKLFTEISGTKTWIDKETDKTKRPDVKIYLYSSAVGNGTVDINDYTIKATDPSYSYTFTEDREHNPLPTYDSKGKKITYDVKEADIAGYFSEKNGFNFFNTSGDVIISKVDADTRAPLAGATLAVFDGTTEIERWVSGASAHVLDTAVKYGKTYTLREISAPEGYELAPDQTFSIPADGSSITLTMSDKKIIGSVELTKADSATREKLAGAEFELYREGGAQIFATGTTGSYRATSTTSNGRFVTDASGSLVITDLPYGTYYFVETKAPEGYELSSERLGFTILRSGELVRVTYLDPKAVGSVRLRKVDSSGMSLAGAVFELYAKTPRTAGQAASSTIFSDSYYRYGTYRSNAAGEITVDNLPWDDYYFIEVDAPTGYETNKDVNGDDLVYTFTIGAATTRTTIDLGGIVNTPPDFPPPPTERFERGGVVNGVLGVRAKPSSGVLGERVGPVTGDTSNIVLWLLLLTACVATIVATIVTGKKKKTVK